MRKVLLALCAVAALLAACTPKDVLPSSITLNKTAITLEEGGSFTLQALVNPSDAANKEVTWSSSADAVATVDQTGKIVAVKEGKATITATAKAASGVKGTCEVTVTAKAIPVTAVQLSETDPISMKPEETLQLSAVLTPSNATDNNVVWESDNTSVATVDANGKVTAVAGGVAYITAKAGGIASDALMVTVFEPRGMFAKYKSITLRQGQNLTGETAVWVYYGNENDYMNREDVDTAVWSSQDESIVTVENGDVRSVAPGSTTIKAEDGLGSSVTIPVTVVALPEITEDWLPGIQLISPTQLYDSQTGLGWFANGNRHLGKGYVEGTECFHVKDHEGVSETTGTNYLIAQCKFEPVDISSIQNPALYIRFYCNDISKLKLSGADSQIELASRGMDSQELNWTGGRVFTNWPGHAPEYAKYELKDGWNTIVLPFDGYAEGDVAGSFNPFNPKKVCWFRWYPSPYETNLLGADVEIAIDQLRVVDWTEYASIEAKNKQHWIESGTANNWAAYEYKEELDGHNGVFGATDEYIDHAISNIWLRARRDVWQARQYSIPANMETKDLKLVWQWWIDDPDFFNTWTTTIEIATGANTADAFDWKWTHQPGELNLKKGWNTIEEDLGAGFHHSDPDPHSLYTFRIVLTPETQHSPKAPSRHSYYIDDVRIVKK